MTQYDVEQFILGAESLVKENKKVLNFMQDLLPNLKLRYEESKLLIDKKLYEQQVDNIKFMECHIQKLEGYIETYKKTLKNW